MADTERPKRLRGAKLLEAGYRAGYWEGFDAGYAQGKLDASQLAAISDRKRLAYSEAVEAGLTRLLTVQQAKPKRRHRKTVEVDARTDEQKLRDLAQDRANGV